MNISNEFNPRLSHHFYFIRKGLLSAMRKNAGILHGIMLDFGCGSKPYKSLINVEKYVGLDFDNPGHDHSNENIDVYYDGKKIPFEENYFDSILCTEVVEHLFDFNYTLGEMHRVLRPGGKMLITCPFVWTEHELPYDYARYTQFALEDLFQKSGFKILHFEKRGNFIEAVTQMRVLYYFGLFGSFFLRLSLFGRVINKTCLFLINGWGLIKSKILPPKYDLYLSNVMVVEKI